MVGDSPQVVQGEVRPLCSKPRLFSPNSPPGFLGELRNPALGWGMGYWKPQKVMKLEASAPCFLLPRDRETWLAPGWAGRCGPDLPSSTLRRRRLLLLQGGDGRSKAALWLLACKLHFLPLPFFTCLLPRSVWRLTKARSLLQNQVCVCVCVLSLFVCQSVHICKYGPQSPEQHSSSSVLQQLFIF